MRPYFYPWHCLGWLMLGAMVATVSCVQIAGVHVRELDVWLMAASILSDVAMIVSTRPEGDQ